ncbi:MAG: hypothetical protein ACMG6E_06705 [Candidatus Roizmanbacteria bacterium]
MPYPVKTNAAPLVFILLAVVALVELLLEDELELFPVDVLEEFDLVPFELELVTLEEVLVVVFVLVPLVVALVLFVVVLLFVVFVELVVVFDMDVLVVLEVVFTLALPELLELVAVFGVF